MKEKANYPNTKNNKKNKKIDHSLAFRRKAKIEQIFRKKQANPYQSKDQKILPTNCHAKMKFILQ